MLHLPLSFLFNRSNLLPVAESTLVSQLVSRSHMKVAPLRPLGEIWNADVSSTRPCSRIVAEIAAAGFAGYAIDRRHK